MTIENQKFIDESSDRFSEVLNKFGFDFVEVVESGFFGNCELVYRSDDKIISIQRDKGSLRVYYGFEVNGNIHTWLIDLLVKALLKDSSGIYKELKGLLNVNDEFHEFDLEYGRYVKLIDAFIEEIDRNLFSGDLLEAKEKLNEFSQNLSKNYIADLARKNA